MKPSAANVRGSRDRLPPLVREAVRWCIPPHPPYHPPPPLPPPRHLPDHTLREMKHMNYDALLLRCEAAESERDRLSTLINTPEIASFLIGASNEAAHQRVRWPSEQDAGKTDADWFWLIGYLAGKAMHNLAAGNKDKGLHHLITTAAACANWHHQRTVGNDMRPGIAEPEALKSTHKES